MGGMSDLALCDISDILPKGQTATTHHKTHAKFRNDQSPISDGSLDEQFKHLAEKQDDLLDDLHSASQEMNATEDGADKINRYQVLEESN